MPPKNYNTVQEDVDESDVENSSVTSEQIDELSSPRNQETRPLLSPDDPRVTPLNSNKVQWLRLSLKILLVINVIWFVISLVSYFVTIPGFDSHGKSFLEFSFVIISLYLNFITWLFLLVPSDLNMDHYLNFGCFALVAIDLILMIGVPSERRQLGASEFLSIAFTLVSISLNHASNKLVLTAKKNEEIRLTGRVETRKTFREYFLTSMEVVLKSLLAVYVIAISLNIGLRSIDLMIVKPWGKMVSSSDDEYRIHLFCEGVSNFTSSEAEKDSSPIVLIESGDESSEEFVGWIQELYQLNKIDKYCIYDRPGYAFSDSVPSPYSLGVNADILRNVLDSEKIEGKFMLVSHGIGGLYSRVFASRNIDKIHSMVLVDAWSEELLLTNPFKHSKNKDKKLPYPIYRLNRRHGLKLWVEGVFSLSNLETFYDLIVHRRKSSDRIFGYDMRLSGKYYRSKLQEQVSAGMLSYNDVSLSKNIITNSEIPVSVVSSKGLIKSSLNWGNWQRELTKITSNSLNEWLLLDTTYEEAYTTPSMKRQLQQLVLRMMGRSDKFSEPSREDGVI